MLHKFYKYDNAIYWNLVLYMYVVHTKANSSQTF